QLSERSAELERSEQARGELEEKLGREKASLQQQLKSLEGELSARSAELERSEQARGELEEKLGREKASLQEQIK
ncbi:hypothetical protein, partial [Wenzhouxiangella limi]